jgi:hypothetical protein
LVTLLLVLGAAPVAAQSARLSRDSRLYKDPGSGALGTLVAGAPVTVGDTRGSSVEVTVEGWIFSRSVGPFDRDGFDLSVTGHPSENLRSAPNGTVLARLVTGTGLVKVESKGAWVRVRRTAWIDARAVPAQAAASPDTPAGGSDRAELNRRAPLVVTPGGGEIGAVDSGAGLKVLARSGGWTRVQLEGWVPDSAVTIASSGVLVGVSQAEVRADPARYVGATVEWRVQFVAVQKADELRPEIPMGTPYLLTRGPLPEPGFVYVMIRPDQAAQFEALPPLRELTIRGIIRSASTKYLPTPVLELVSVVEGLGS